MTEKELIESLLPGPGVSINENNIYLRSHSQLQNNSYFFRVILRWESEKKPFDYDLFKKIFNYLVNRHDAFSYTYHQDQKTKKVFKRIQPGPQHIDIPIHKLPHEESDRLFLDYCKELGKSFFPLVSAPLLKVNVVYDIKQVAYTVIYIPHIIMDAYSNARVLYSELAYLYRTFIDRPESERTFEKFRAELKDPKPYADFVEEEKVLFEKKLDFVKSYYKEKYKPVDLNNKYVTLETKEKMVRGMVRLFEKTQSFKDFLEKNNLKSSQVIFTLFQLSLLQALDLAAVPIVKMFNNRTEEYNQTLGFMAREFVFVEELKHDQTLEDLYKRNIVTTRYMVKNVQDVDGTVAVRLLGLPIPRFKYNFIPKEMADVTDDEIRFISDTDLYDSWNWDGEFFKIKFGFTPYEHEDFISLIGYNTPKDFPDDVAEAIMDINKNLLQIAPKIWRTPIKNIPKNVSSDLGDSKL